jgi:hypothetical protein
MEMPATGPWPTLASLRLLDTSTFTHGTNSMTAVITTFDNVTLPLTALRISPLNARKYDAKGSKTSPPASKPAAFCSRSSLGRRPTAAMMALTSSPTVGAYARCNRWPMVMPPRPRFLAFACPTT